MQLNEIDVLKINIHFWGTSSISVPQLWKDSLLFKGFSTTFIQYMLHTEVTANQLKSNRCFLCARLKSMYWKSISTFGAHLQFQCRSCEEIVYFSRDFSTTFIHYMQHTEVTANQLKKSSQDAMYWNCKIALLQFQIAVKRYWKSRDIYFHSIYAHTEVIGEFQLKSNRCFLCARLK